MNITNLFSNNSISSCQNENIWNKAGKQSSFRMAGFTDSITISAEGMEKYQAFKSTQETDKNNITVESYYNNFMSGMISPTPDYSKWPQENLDRLHEIWASSEAADAAEGPSAGKHPSSRSQKLNDFLDANFDKIMVLNALSRENVVVTDEVMIKSLEALETAKGKWEKLAPVSRPLIDGDGVAISLEGGTDVEKEAEKMKVKLMKWKDTQFNLDGLNL